MPIYKIKLLEHKEATKDTFEFIFEKPAGFHFVPGQYGGFTLIHPQETDAGGMTRRFSLFSSPDEEYIKIVTRIQNSAYKRVLKALPVGSEIKLAGPVGKFILHEDTSVPAVFIAGGIGITPFHSMIQYATEHQSPQKIYLFYGNLNRETAAFLDELTAFQNKNSQFKLIATLDKVDNNWHGETGFINEVMLKKYIDDLNAPIYYICGSPSMVAALHATLKNIGIQEDRIRIEEFPGY